MSRTRSGLDLPQPAENNYMYRVIMILDVKLGKH
jgi:hypothetical protein